MFETALFNINDLTVLSVGILSLTLAALLILRRQDNRIRNLLLAAFFLQAAFYSIDTLLYWNRNINQMMSAVSANFFFGLGIGCFLQGPLLYWAVRASISTRFRLRPQDFLHLLPAAVFPFYLYAIYYRFDEVSKLRFVHDWALVGDNPYFFALIWAQSASLFFYGMWCLRQLVRYLAHLEDKGVDKEKSDVRWLKLLVYGFAFINGWNLLILVSSRLIDIGSAAYVMGTIENYFRFALMGGLMIFLTRHSIGFPAIRPEYAIDATLPADAVHDHQLQKLRTLMETEQAYLQPNINLERLAARLNMSPKSLSALINKKLGRNFFEMIRDYRIEEARKRLVDAKHRHQSITEIMQDAGFNSKSVFNQSFKDKFGATPSAYRKLHLP